MLNYNTILKVITFWALIIILQVFLSKRKNKWVGLILPPISLLVSFKVNSSIPDYFWGPSISQNNMERIKFFLLNNISTVFLIAIFLIFHERIKKNKEIDKMNIQDLN